MTAQSGYVDEFKLPPEEIAERLSICATHAKDSPDNWTHLNPAARNLLLAAAATLRRIVKMIEEQANDDGLWFEAETCAEAYVQRQLRLLHAAVEGTDFFGRAAS